VRAVASGFRKDVLGLLRELRLGVLRWPGGEESNRFGTDEYLAYCDELGTEPYICLNMGTGTAQLEEGSEDPEDGMVAVRLPPRSFTVIEAPMTGR
jgi:alpha-L-arabinofuranosidase